VLQKWVIIMDRRQGTNATSTAAGAGKSGPSAEDRYCARDGFRKRHKETAWKRRRIKTCLVILIVMLHVLTYVVSYKLFRN